MATHYLKTDAALFDAIKNGDKNFEIRKNDRFYQAGDTVVLQRIVHPAPVAVPMQPFMPGDTPKPEPKPEEIRFRFRFRSG